MAVRRLAAAILILAAGTAAAAPASAATEDCRRAVIVTLPGVRWQDVREVAPPGILRAVEDGAAGSISVRTNASRTTYASGFATIGGGARLDGTRGAGGPVGTPAEEGPFAPTVQVAGTSEMVGLAEDAGYGARPGALAGALPEEHELVAIGNGDFGLPAPVPFGYGRYVLLAAMNHAGVVERAATGAGLLTPAEGWPFGIRTDPDALVAAVDEALSNPCTSIVIDPGDLVRADRLAALALDPLDMQRRAALLATDALVEHLLDEMVRARDLLLIVSPSSPSWLSEAHLGVAIAIGPGFGAGDTLVSASTRRRGIVTLPDVAPTVLRHVGVERPASMTGRSWITASIEVRDRVSMGVALDDETVFVDRIKSPVNTAFVLFQIAVYLVALALLWWREQRGKGTGTTLGRMLEIAGLGIVAFPVATFLAGVVTAHAMGAAGYVGLIVAIDIALVGGATLLASRPLDRLFALVVVTLGVLSVDLVTGSRLQINTIFGYSPIVAGRFSGAGNIAFSVLAATAVVTAALYMHRVRTARARVAVAVLFAGVIVVDGAPQFGSDVGGVLALVPGFAITWMLLAGIRPTLRAIGVAALATAVVVALFLAVDVSRPPEARTHLAQLFERVRGDGPSVFTGMLRRKAEANVRVFRSSIYTFFVPPALGVMTWLAMRPRGRWGRLAQTFPRPRAGLIGGLVVGILGFVVNDSGIVIPAVVLSFLVPMTLMLHLAIELREAE